MTRTPVVFANAQKLISDYLQPLLAASPDPLVASAVVDTQVPSTRSSTATDPLVVVRRVGGTADRVHDRARLDFLAWHAGEFEAERLAQAVRSLILFDLPGRVLAGHQVLDDVAEFGGPALFPDPVRSGQQIYLQTHSIPIRGATP